MLKRKDFIKLTDTIISKKGKIFNKDEIFKIDFIGKNSWFLLMRNKENQFVFDIKEIEGKYIIIKDSYVFSLKELEQFKETTSKQCDFCILDNMDNIHTCILYGKQAFDICISKDYIPNKYNCDRYKIYNE